MKLFTNDNIGYVEILQRDIGYDIMIDRQICNSARVSFNRDQEKYTVENNIRLLHYLAKHKHTSPFNHVSFTFRMKMPLFTCRQFFKHRVGVEINEKSMRYVRDENLDFFFPQALRTQSKSNKQASTNDIIATNTEMIIEMKELTKQSNDLYKKLLKNGCCGELARIILPQNMYCEFICTASLTALKRIYDLRITEDAQYEIREYVQLIDNILSSLDFEAWKIMKQY